MKQEQLDAIKKIKRLLELMQQVIDLMEMVANMDEDENVLLEDNLPSMDDLEKVAAEMQEEEALDKALDEIFNSALSGVDFDNSDNITFTIKDLEPASMGSMLFNPNAGRESSNRGVFSTEEEKDEDEDLAVALSRIKKIFGDLKASGLLTPDEEKRVEIPRSTSYLGVLDDGIIRWTRL